MRLFFFFSLIITSLNIHAQYIEYDINWIDGIEYEIEKNKVNVPKIENFENNYSFNQSYSIVKQWKDSQLIDANSIKLVNAEFSNLNSFVLLKRLSIAPCEMFCHQIQYFSENILACFALFCKFSRISLRQFFAKEVSLNLE